VRPSVVHELGELVDNLRDCRLAPIKVLGEVVDVSGPAVPSANERDTLECGHNVPRLCDMDRREVEGVREAVELIYVHATRRKCEFRVVNQSAGWRAHQK
jgi:hypothetical protein